MFDFAARYEAQKTAHAARNASPMTPCRFCDTLTHDADAKCASCRQAAYDRTAEGR